MQERSASYGERLKEGEWGYFQTGVLEYARNNMEICAEMKVSGWLAVWGGPIHE
jgi:hypothetical protein